MPGRRNQTMTGPQLAGWCGPMLQERRSASALTAEIPGYVAMLSFLAAYVLSVAGMGDTAQRVLNLAGAGAGVLYLHRKHAVPSVISNLAWMAITVAGMVAR